MTRPIPQEVIDALGLPEGFTRTPAGADTVPPSSRAVGFSTAERQDAPPPFVPVTLSALVRPHVEAARSASDERLIVLRAPRGVSPIRDGRRQPPLPSLVIDARAREEHWAWVDTDEGGVLIHVLDANLEPELIGYPPHPAWAAAIAASPPKEAPLLVPRFETLTCSMPCETWLADEFRRLASSRWSVERAAAVGLVGRLFSPAATEVRPKGVMPIVPAETPRTVARRWFAALAPQLRANVHADGARRAETLREDLEEIEAQVTDEAPSARDAVLRSLLSRDDLECVAFLGRELASTPERAWLIDALAALDRHAAEHLSIFFFLEPFTECDRLRAVAWQEPEQWWGRAAIDADEEDVLAD